MKPWAGYVRVSFVGGRSGESFRSVEDQAREIRNWAARERVEVIMLDPELDGKSNDAARPILREAVDGVRDGRFAGVVTAYLSRAARDLRLTLDLWHEIEANGGKVACATVNIDSSTIEGRMTRNILASVDQAQREQLAASFERQVASAVERGIWQRRQTPTGYDRDPETRRLVPNEDAEKVRQAFRDVALGKPLVRIAADLSITPSGTRQLLRNRVYLGELRVRSHINESAHPALVTEEEFEAAMATRRTRPARARKEPALLAGLVRCAGCGHVMSRTAGGTGHESYGCSTVKSLGRCPEPATISLPLLDGALERVVVRELAAHSVRAVKDTSAVEEAQGRLTAARRDLATFLDVTASAGLDAETMAAGLRQRQDRVRDAERDLAGLVVVGGLPVVDDPAGLWAGFDHGERLVLLRGLVEAVVVRRVGRGKVVPVGERVRVVRFGAGLFGTGGGGRALPLRGVWPALDDERVIGVPLVEDAG